MALNHPPGVRSHPSSSPSSLNPAVARGRRGTPPAANIDDDTASVGPWRLPPPPPRPKLLLDSGASIHVVGDPRLLSNLRDAPAGMTITVANGDALPVTKIGDIQMAADGGFRIPGVHLAPGLKSDVISVRDLTRSGVRTWFDGDRATLYAGPELVGVAVAPPEKYGLYVLQFLRLPKGGGMDGGGEIRLVPVVWFGSVLSRLKALLRAQKRLVSAGTEEKKPMREPHFSSSRIQREQRRKMGNNSGRGRR